MLNIKKLTYSRKLIDEIKAMCDELIEAHKTVGYWTLC